MPFETVEHTGDLALRLRAPDFGGLIEAGVLGLRSIIFEGSPPDAEREEERRARVSGVDREDALVQALSEALYVMQGENLYPLRVDARTPSATLVDLRLRALRVDGETLRRVEEIKAVTYHAVEIRERAGELEATVVLDV